ncbi:nucleotide exchange factor GrpE [Candidatus Sumerlaeota bacterium]|nr:nucleotide exchange factor GrpE [Candidatus Sumerlaeota bacterium]
MDWRHDQENSKDPEENLSSQDAPSDGEGDSIASYSEGEIENDLASAISALETENRKQIRAFRKFIENFAAFSDRIDDSLRNMRESIMNVNQKDMTSLVRSVREETARDIFRNLLDVRDSLARGVEKARLHLGKMSALRKFAAGKPLLDSLIEGQEVALQRLDDLMAHSRILEMEAIGKIFDPHCMRATATLETDDVPEGTVVEILRKGYVMDDSVLRYAEVRVAKSPSRVKQED